MVTSAPDRDRSPLTSRRFIENSIFWFENIVKVGNFDNVFKPANSQGKQTSNPFFNQTSDIDTSNDSFFSPGIRQPDFT